MTLPLLALWLTAVLTVPHPDLSSAEPNVRQQIVVTREALEKEAGDTPRKAELYGVLGMIYQAYDLTAAAEACYRNAIAIRPEFRWHYYLAHVLADRGDADAAVTAFETALRLDPGYLPGTLRLARLHLERQDLDAAQRLYEQALTVDPDEAETLTGLGRVAFARGDYESAVTRLREALAQAPHATEIHHLLGLSHARLGKRDEARAFLARGGDVRAVRVDAFLRNMQMLDRGGQEHQDRGVTLLADGDLRGALRAFGRGVEARPRDPRAHANLGLAQLRSGDVDAAESAFRTALAIDGSYPLAHFNLGTILASRGNDEEAIAHYRAALRSDPTLVEARFNLANALRRTARLAESIAEYRGVIEAEPAMARARLQEALALIRLERYVDARARLEEAHRLLPEDPWLRQALVRVLAASPDPAARDGRRAVELAAGLAIDAAPVEQLAARAMAWAESGRFGEAVRDQQAALDAAAEHAGPAMLELLRTNLDLYREGLPCRSPWRKDGPELSPRSRRPYRSASDPGAG